jgi:hypothetical protein
VATQGRRKASALQDWSADTIQQDTVVFEDDAITMKADILEWDMYT